MQQGFFYNFSNYGTYDRLTDDGLIKWHPGINGGFAKGISIGINKKEVIDQEVSFYRRY